MEDIALAVETLKENGCSDFALMHCVSQYPAKYEDMNLRCIDTLKKNSLVLLAFRITQWTIYRRWRLWF
jgi:sialic acid synthase SpsE